MKRLILLVLVWLFYSGSAWASCDTTLASDSTTQLICDSNDELTVNQGVTLDRTGKYAVSAVNDDNVKITNHGTITNDNHFTLHMRNTTDATIDNKSTGIIQSTGGCCTIDYKGSDGTFTLTNAGTIISRTHGTINNWGSSSSIVNITNSGTIRMRGISVSQSNVEALCAICTAGSTGAVTITNSGTIETIGDDRPAIYTNDETASTIINSGTISGHGTAKDILVADDASGTATTTIKISGEGSFDNGIELNDTTVQLVLEPDIKRDTTVTIYNKDNLTIVNNLTGNDTYSITSENLDSGEGDTTLGDGVLTILGEDLEIAQDNPKYRSENVLTKLRGLFDAANYINWHFPEDKMFKIFHSEQKRDGTYKGEMSGVVGQLSPFILGDIRNNIFLGYTRQDGDFDNGEFLGGDNFALGLKSVYENNGFKASFTPMIGLNDLTVTDFDTDTKTKISTNLLSEFAGFNTKLGKEIKTSKDSSLSLNIQSTLGVQRFPEYLAKFSQGDLSVDEAIEQVLGAGFEVRYVEGLGKGFVIQPYIGANVNNNLNNSIKITADGDNKNVSPANEMTTGYFAGVSFTKKTEDINFDLDLMYGNEDGLINQIAAISLTKSFGKSEKQDENIKPDQEYKTVSALSSRDLKEIKDLKYLNEILEADNKLLKAENKKLMAQNKKLANLNENLEKLSIETLKENKDSKKLIVELLKENEKIKLEKEIFKNKILKAENEELKENTKILQEIEKGVSEDDANRFKLLIFITILFLITSAFVSFVARTR